MLSARAGATLVIASMTVAGPAKARYMSLSPEPAWNEEPVIARKPNYSFERHERERVKAIKVAEKAAAKREQRERERDPSKSEDTGDDA